MAREEKTTWICDKCGHRSEEIGVINTAYWKHDTKMDAAGSLEYLVGEIDLCGECSSLILEYALEELRYENAAKLMTRVLKNKIRVEK